MKNLFLIIIACIWTTGAKADSPSDTSRISKYMNTLHVAMNQGTDYTVSCSNWLSVASQNSETGIYDILSLANHLSQKRTGKIIFKHNGNTVREITVEQDGSFSDCTVSQLTQDIKAGWNLGNTMECVGSWINSSKPTNYETAWGNPITTREIFKMVKDNGFDAVRIPCSWYSHTLKGSNYTIDSKWMARVKEVVELALSEDLIVIMNCHWDGGWLNCNNNAIDSVKNIQSILWTQIAKSMEQYDEYLLFASANEPDVTKAEQMNALQTYHQAFIDAVRSNGDNNAKRCLVIQAPSTSTELAIQYFSSFYPSDNVKDKLMLEVHYYTPYNFCLMEKDESWGNMHYFWGTKYHTGLVDGVSRNCTYGEEVYANQQMALMRTNFTAKGISVMMGEYSANYRTLADTALQNRHNLSREYWYEYISKQARLNGVIPFVWDAGQILNRRTLTTAKDPFALKGIKDGIAKYVAADIDHTSLFQDSDIVTSTVYDINGIQTHSPEKGIHIVKYVDKKGYSLSRKILIK